jgi:hypothetical protein
VWAVPRLCELYPGISLTTEEKARKNLSYGSRIVPHIPVTVVQYTFTHKQYTERNIHNNIATALDNGSMNHSGSSRRNGSDAHPERGTCWASSCLVFSLNITKFPQIRWVQAILKCLRKCTKTGNVRLNVTSMRVRPTIVAVEKL